MTHITIKREVLQQALDAANSVQVVCEDFHHKKSDQHHHSDVCKPMVRFEVACAALRTALEAKVEDSISKRNAAVVAMYDQPAAREPLTEAQVDRISKSYGRRYDFVRAIEAAHGICTQRDGV